MKIRKKLVEVALPLQSINEACAREKSIRHGHPSSLHLWWARRPLAVARAMIFAQMVDDPSSHPDLFPTEKSQEKERRRLFRILEQLVEWENSTNTNLLKQAKEEIWQSWRYACADNSGIQDYDKLFNRNKLPCFHDPFAGGGAIPLEAQRLGLESYASDLNPVAVMINKAMIDFPQKFANRQPINPFINAKNELISKDYRGAEGLAEDVRFYGEWFREEAIKRIGNLYPEIEVTAEIAKNRPDLDHQIGKKFTPIAWLWARTVKSPNPAYSNVSVPLATTFMLSTKAGKEAYIEPVIENGEYHFLVKMGKPENIDKVKFGTKSSGSGSSFLCILSGTPMPFEYLRSEAKAGRMGARLMAVIVEGDKGRMYLPASKEMEEVAMGVQELDILDSYLPAKALGFRVQEYGMTKWRDLYTKRQLMALHTFCDLIPEVISKVKKDALALGHLDDGIGLSENGIGVTAYAQTIAVYLSFLIDQQSNQSSTICGWNNINQQMIVTFSRQAIPMVWDFAECNVLSKSTGSYWNLLERQVKGIKSLGIGDINGYSEQKDASTQSITQGKVVSTDPPYYDNIGYADLSDYFYVWLRQSLKPIFPSLFSTVAVPKTEELIATPFRHGNKESAEEFFLTGMTNAMHRIAEQAHPCYPVTIYYAFKQSETNASDGTINTGWDTFLAAVIEAGFAITGTWPVKTESANKLKSNVSALASSIVLVCRPRPNNAPTITKREFLSALKQELPDSLMQLQAGNIAPVDLAQAAIGPGMSVFSRFSRVIDADGEALTVRSALAMINQILDESLAEQDGDFDAESRWALTWFEQNGFAEADYGSAEQLSKSKNISLESLVECGILFSKAGKVRLLKPGELKDDRLLTSDLKVIAWKIVHQLIKSLETDGESSAATLVANLGTQAESSRELCYRLYTLCERKKRTVEALAYNGLVQSWPEIIRLSRERQISAGLGNKDLFNQD